MSYIKLRAMETSGYDVWVRPEDVVLIVKYEQPRTSHGYITLRDGTRVEMANPIPWVVDQLSGDSA
jgi:hypothetical protein